MCIDNTLCMMKFYTHEGKITRLFYVKIEISYLVKNFYIFCISKGVVKLAVGDLYNQSLGNGF